MKKNIIIKFIFGVLLAPVCSVYAENLYVIGYDGSTTLGSIYIDQMTWKQCDDGYRRPWKGGRRQNVVNVYTTPPPSLGDKEVPFVLNYVATYTNDDREVAKGAIIGKLGQTTDHVISYDVWRDEPTCVTFTAQFPEPAILSGKAVFSQVPIITTRWSWIMTEDNRWFANSGTYQPYSVSPAEIHLQWKPDILSTSTGEQFAEFTSTLEHYVTASKIEGIALRPPLRITLDNVNPSECSGLDVKIGSDEWQTGFVNGEDLVLKDTDNTVNRTTDYRFRINKDNAVKDQVKCTLRATAEFR